MISSAISSVISSVLRSSAALLLLTAVGACDSAERSGEQATVVQSPPGESTEFESCASTADCVGNLRCLNAQCASKVRSRLGDFHAARGRKALAEGDLSGVATAYNEAITTYEKESLSPPLELLCEQGMALAKAREDEKLAEAAARILHKCVLAVPPSSTIAMAAMDSLATLGEVGLDGELLARSEPADLYLTGESSGPDMSKLRVQVSSDGKSTKSSFNGFVEALRSDENKARFQACWQESWKQHKAEMLDVSVEVSYRFHWDPDDESRDRAEIKVSEMPGLSGSAKEASECVQAAASEAALAVAKKTRQDTRWKSKIRIQIGEGS
ncbi:MAG: hypothetical protein GY811_04205 [Myxococcales bacterium]|nr:hypothetical protein [Myxococcales bacterium]